ncbi:MAG: DUF4139 domain-containing protein, partial [Nitrospiraceae bacterium]
KDVRELNLPRGRIQLRFMDIASRVQPATVYIRSLKDPESLGILEQNYEYDLLNPQKLLDKYVGKKVRLYMKNYYTEREETVEALVLSANENPIFQIGDEISYGHPGRIIFPGVPEDLISRPTLVWLLENSLGSPQTVEAAYLTDGISWRADYIVTLSKDDDRADMAGWVTIDNQSGAAYRDAKLKLVAGDVHRVQEGRGRRDDVMYVPAARAAEEQFAEEQFFEYHIYTLQRPSTIRNNQTKQISLLSSEGIPVKKELVFQGARHFFLSRFSDRFPDQNAGVYVEIENRIENNLGMPIPKGIVRVYKHDREGSLQFVGEDSVGHTPKDETIRVRLGEAFDVKGSRVQTGWSKLARDTYEAEFEISLRNHKEEDVEVRVIEPVPGDWTVISSSHEYKKADAFTAEFPVTVPEGGEVKIKYKVRMRF